MYEKFLLFRNYGSTTKYINSIIGFNSRLDELQAAFLRLKLPLLDEANELESKLSQELDEIVSLLKTNMKESILNELQRYEISWNENKTERKLARMYQSFKLGILPDSP